MPASLYFRNGHLLWLTVVLIVVAGASAMLTMPRLEDPRIVNRTPIVITPVPGASASRVETLVTERIEQELEDVAEIDNLDSRSSAGVSVISVELAPSVDAGENERVFSKIRDRLGDAADDLPPEAQPPILEDQRDPVAYSLIVGVRWDGAGEGPQLPLLSRIAEDLANRLRRLEGTEIVELYGEASEEITVALDYRQAAELGLTPRGIAALLRDADSKEAAGVLRPENYDLSIEVDGGFDLVGRIARVPVAGAADGAVLRLGDVASLERSYRDPPNEIALVDGRRLVMVAARTKSDVQVDNWVGQAREVVADLSAGTGGNVALDIVFDQSVYTVARLGEVAGNLGLGALVVTGVVLLTMGWRAGLIVGAQLPLVALGALWVIMSLGGALHQISIFGMIIALGLLVDNAIVMTDHVARGLKAGKSRRRSVADAQRHLFGPLLASATTTVMAFAPIPLLTGAAGDFVGWIGGSVIVAILLSFLTSQSVVPALAGRFLKSHKGAGALETGVSWPRGVEAFQHLLRYAFRRPVLAVVVATAPAITGFALIPTMGNQFFPLVDRNMFDVRLWLPRAASIDRTREVAERIDARLRSLEEVRQTSWLVGASHPPVYYNLIENQDRSPHYAQAQVVVGTGKQADRLVRRLQREFDETIPDARILVREYGLGPPIFADIQYRLFGRDEARLKELGERMRLALQQHEKVLHTRMTTARGEPKLWLAADEDETRLAGLTLGDLSDQLNAALGGRTGGAILEGLTELPVRVRYGDAPRASLEAIASAPVLRPATSGDASPEWTPMEAFGRFELRPETPQLARYDRLRVNTVEGYVISDALPITISDTVLQRLEESGFELPDGYHMELGGAAEESGEAVGRLLGNVPPLAVIMFGALLLVFRSIGRALIITAEALLIVGLAFLTTWAIGFPYSFPMILGMLGLIGVGLNDSIVVLSEIDKEDADNAGDPEAAVRAVTAVLRHVLSTTLTTIGGFLPLLILIGGDFWPSLAIVLAGGIPFATLLSIGFVPAAYILLMKLQRRRRGAEAAA